MISVTCNSWLWTLAAGVLALDAAAPLRAAEPSLPACMNRPPVAMVVRIGDAPPRRGWLRGGISPPLQVIDADTAQTIWSAAARPPASQLFNALHAQFAGSLLPLDLDGDGIHDRIYAGDFRGRLWRFDLHHGQPAEQWATGGVFGDFSAGLRGFVAAPDVSLPAVSVPGSPADPPAPPAPWFNIALGTARLGPGPVENRFYVLRDRSAFASWSQDEYDRWPPLREDDLVQLPRLGATLPGPAPNGYFVTVGASEILSPTLTVSGRATLALAAPGSASDTRCAIAVVVSSIDLVTGSQRLEKPDGSRPARLTLPMRAGEAFTLHREGHHATCMLGETRVPACDVDLAPLRTWWRREDAD